MTPFRRRPTALDSIHDGVLGTRLSVSIRGARTAVLRNAERQLLAEIDRLESVFSAFRPDSELNLWKADAGGDAALPSEALLSLLSFGKRWHELSGGVFNPCVGVLSDRWRLAAETQVLPTAEEMRALASGVSTMPYDVSNGVIERWGDCSSLNFNALAKGLLIDVVAASAANGVELSSIVVNIGGDLVHRGNGVAAVRVEDPFRPYDNAAPLDTVFVANAGVATSGSTKRGVHIGDTWFSHVLDPRTGWPVDEVMSATVVAANAAVADAVATVISVLPPTEGIAFAETLDQGLACAIVGADRSVLTNEAWDALRRR